MPPKRKFNGPQSNNNYNNHNSHHGGHRGGHQGGHGHHGPNNRFNHNNNDNPNKRPRLPPPPPKTPEELLPPLLQKLTTSLHRSLKLSRSIELKKISRRLQTAADESNQTASDKHNLERTTLLALDLRMAARRLMAARIKKDRVLKDKLDALGVKVPSEEGDENVGKESEILVARLGGYKVVRENLGGAVEGVRKSLGMEETLCATNSEAESESEDDGWAQRKAEKVAAEKEAERKKLQEEEEEEEESEEEEDEEGESTVGEEEGLRNRMGGLAVEDDDQDDDGWETNSEGEMVRVSRGEAMDVDELESDVEGGWETNSEGEMVQIKPTKLVSRKFDSDSDAQTEPSSSKKNKKEKEKEKDKPDAKKKEKEKKKPIPEKPKSSTFLPSLMHGYVSGSDSDVEDIDDRQNSRKNRRGQRARRAIWEKKYGENAEFKKKMRAKGIYMDDKGRRIDPSRAAFIDASGAKGHVKSGKPGFKSKEGVAAPPVRDAKPKPPRKRDDEGPIHPSWEAARKKKMEAGPVAFQGKKITFD